MQKVLRTEQKIKSPVGIESQIEMSGYYYVRKTPTGDLI